jgi:hypothetical protein
MKNTLASLTAGLTLTQRMLDRLDNCDALITGCVTDSPITSQRVGSTIVLPRCPSTGYLGCDSMAAWTSAFGSMYLVAEPGESWSYSVGFDIFGDRVEVVSGVSLEDLLQSKLFWPLGMIDTGFWVAPGVRRQFLVVGHYGGSLLHAPADCSRIVLKTAIFRKRAFSGLASSTGYYKLDFPGFARLL